MSWSIYKKGDSKKVAAAILTSEFPQYANSPEGRHIMAAKAMAADMITAIEDAPAAEGGRLIDAGPVFVNVEMSGSESSYDGSCSVKVTRLMDFLL